MSSIANNTEEASPSSITKIFPLEAQVILQGLLKAPDLNGNVGVIRSDLSSSNRHTVYIPELDRSVGLKPSNLRYIQRTLESLSVKELKMILKHKKKQSDDVALSGMDKSDLQSEISKHISSSDEIPELLAKVKAKELSQPVTGNNNTNIGAQAADNLNNMNPEQLRQQARLIRSMESNMIRRTNPQLANMTDDQLRMMADQMEMMANNPHMMKMAADKMKNMNPAEIQMMQAQMTKNGTSRSNTSNTTSSIASNNSSAKDMGSNRTPTSAINQAQQAADMMSNMSPEQLRQQAQMLKTMDPDTIRQTNPQMAHMSDEQIRMAANQFEMIAANPAMMKMAMEQMKNVTPQQLDSMSKPTAGSPVDITQMGSDPSQMLAGIDKSQLKQMLNSLKDNPEMMKQVASMTGMKEDQLKKGVESFAGMDDAKMDFALKMIQSAQKVKEKWDQIDTKVDGHLPKILIVIGLLILGWIISYFFFRRRTIFTDDEIHLTTTTTHSDDDLDSEF
mmetsp:Transcript_44525/g.49915  ORF Transcript_44525/g.49915 Transcript_44525/m.49915 type:complete len:505 (-) Transcript_44525:62-1576(-)